MEVDGELRGEWEGRAMCMARRAATGTSGCSRVGMRSGSMAGVGSSAVATIGGRKEVQLEEVEEGQGGEPSERATGQLDVHRCDSMCVVLL